MAFNLNTTVTGLGTTNISIPSAGPFTISGKLTLPSIVAGDAVDSQVIVTVVQNPLGANTTIYTGSAGAEGFSVLANCAANDTIAVTTSSSTSVDKPLNVIKTTISVG